MARLARWRLAAVLSLACAVAACSPSAERNETAEQAPGSTAAGSTSERLKGAGIEAVPLMDTKGWVDSRTKWASPRISVCWEPSAQNYTREQGWIKDALAKSWEDASAVHFVGFNACTAGQPGIHVALEDSGARTLGLGKELDTIKNGLRLNPVFSSWNSWCADDEATRESCVRANAVHEFGHALGFVHEQNRQDTPTSCNAPRQGSDGDLILTPWDPDSIMNYCNRDRMRKGGRLSQGDRDAVEKFYGNEM